MATRALKTLGALQSLTIFGALFALLVRGGQTTRTGLLEDLSPLRSVIQAIAPVDRFPEAGVPLADGARIVLEPETSAISLGAQEAAGGAPGPSSNGGIANGGGADANEPPPPEPDPGAQNGDDHPGQARGHGAEHPGNGKALGHARNGGDGPDRHASGDGNDHGRHWHRAGRAHGHDDDEERRSSSGKRGRAKGHDRRT